MRHHPDFSLRHPVTALRDCSPEVQALVGYISPKRGTAVTRDGRLTCTCGKSTNCTCKAVTRDAAEPGKADKPRISQAVAIEFRRYLEL
jgi:hypothetical protein